MIQALLCVLLFFEEVGETTLLCDIQPLRHIAEQNNLRRAIDCIVKDTHPELEALTVRKTYDACTS